MNEATKAPWWAWWITGIVLVAVFCWQPGPFVALVQAMTALGFVGWLVLMTVRHPEAVRSIVKSIPQRTVQYQDPAGGKVTLFSPEQSKALPELTEDLQSHFGDEPEQAAESLDA